MAASLCPCCVQEQGDPAAGVRSAWLVPGWPDFSFGKLGHRRSKVQTRLLCFQHRLRLSPQAFLEKDVRARGAESQGQMGSCVRRPALEPRF